MRTPREGQCCLGCCCLDAAAASTPLLSRRCCCLNAATASLLVSGETHIWAIYVELLARQCLARTSPVSAPPPACPRIAHTSCNVVAHRQHSVSVSVSVSVFVSGRRPEQRNTRSALRVACCWHCLLALAHTVCGSDPPGVPLAVTLLHIAQCGCAACIARTCVAWPCRLTSALGWLSGL